MAENDFELCPTCNVPVMDGLCNCTAAAKEAEAAAKAAETVQDEPKKPSIREMLATVPGAPPDGAIDQWKSTYGERAVYVMVFTDNEMYVWRPLFRQEFQGLMSNKELVSNEQMLQEAIVRRCVLWPRLSPEQINASRAGLIGTLYSVIMQGSYFLDPDRAAMLVAEL